MPDILEGGMKRKATGGVKTPKQLSTVSGPGISISNKFDVRPQSSLKMTGGKKQS